MSTSSRFPLSRTFHFVKLKVSFLGNLAFVSIKFLSACQPSLRSDGSREFKWQVILILVNGLLLEFMAGTFMLNFMMEVENKSIGNITIFILRSWSQSMVYVTMVSGKASEY